MNKHSKILTLLIAISFVVVLTGVAQQQAEETVTCPVSGKVIKKSEAKTSYEYEGKTCYFCCEDCKAEFIKNPEKYTQKKETKAVYTCPMHPEVKSDKPGKCPKCGMALQKKMVPMKKEMMHMERGMMHHEMMTKKGTCCSKADLMSLKDVEVNVENLDNGVVVKITSKDPEIAKKLQAYAAKMKEMCDQKKAACTQKTEKKEIK